MGVGQVPVRINTYVLNFCFSGWATWLIQESGLSFRSGFLYEATWKTTSRSYELAYHRLLSNSSYGYKPLGLLVLERDGRITRERSMPQDYTSKWRATISREIITKNREIWALKYHIALQTPILAWSEWSRFLGKSLLASISTQFYIIVYSKKSLLWATRPHRSIRV